VQSSLNVLNEIRRLISAGQINSAERLCRQVLQANPQIADAWFLFAQVALAFRQLSDALHCVQQACRLDSQHSDYLFLQAHILFETGEVEAAYQLIKPIMSANQPLSVHQLFGRISWRAGYYDSALMAFSICAASEPFSEASVLPYARALAGLGKRELLLQQLDGLSSRVDCSAEVALLMLHTKLNNESLARVTEQAKEFSQTFAKHLGLEQFVALLLSWHGGAELTTGCFEHDYQLQSVKYALAQRDKHTKLAGLPADVLEHASSMATQDGLWLEFGVCFGRSINILAKYRKGLIHGFDSFQGLPEDWKPGEPKGSYSTGGRLPNVAENVQLHVGWFEQSLPLFLEEHKGPVSLVHIDCDLYSSTVTVLSQLADRLVSGSILIFDDFLGFESFEQHEFKALSEFIVKQGLQLNLISYAALGREVAFQLI